jgi:hypothetical protein
MWRVGMVMAARATGRTSTIALKHFKHKQESCVHFALEPQPLHSSAGAFDGALWQPPMPPLCSGIMDCAEA